MGSETTTKLGFDDVAVSLLQEFGIDDFRPVPVLDGTEGDITSGITSVVNEFIGNLPSGIVGDVHTRGILRQTHNDAGLSALNRLTARIASEKTGIPEDYIVSFIQRESPLAPPAVIAALAEAGRNLGGIDLSRTSKLAAYQGLARSLSGFRREAGSEYDRNLGMQFLQAKFFLDDLASAGSVGNIEAAITDAMLYEEPMNFMLIKCPPKVVEVNRNGRRLYVPTEVATEDLPVGQQLLDLQGKLNSLSVPSTVMFVIPDQNFRLEFPMGSGIVPDADVDRTVDNLNRYALNLGRHFAGSELVVSTMSQIVSGSEYDRIKEKIVLDTLPNYSPYKELVGKEVPKNKNIYVPQGIFEESVGYRREAWKNLYNMDDYPREVANYSIAQMLGDLHGISVIYNNIPNNVFITNHRKVRQNYLGKRIDQREQQRKVLFSGEFV